jgi:hypothetical protein
VGRRARAHCEVIYEDTLAKGYADELGHTGNPFVPYVNYTDHGSYELNIHIPQYDRQIVPLNNRMEAWGMLFLSM